MNKKKIRNISGIAASLLIPITNASTTELEEENNRLYGKPSSLLSQTEATELLNSQNNKISTIDLINRAGIESSIQQSARMWSKILTDEIARKEFTDSPYQTLSRLGLEADYFDDNFEELTNLRIILSDEVQSYIDNNDIKGMLNTLENYGVIKQSYPNLKEQLKTLLSNTNKGEPLFSGSRKELIVANVAIAINVAFIINVWVASNVRTYTLASTESLVFSHRHALDLNDHLIDPELKRALEVINAFSKLDTSVEQSNNLLLSTLKNNELLLEKGINRLLSVQAKEFYSAAAEAGLFKVEDLSEQEQINELLTTLINSIE